MKTKSKTGGGKITVKKPTSARDKPSLRNNIRKSSPQTNPKKKQQKKTQKNQKQKNQKRSKISRKNLRKQI